MDFLKFSMNDVQQSQLDRLIRNWNKKGNARFNFSYRIEQENEGLMCTLTTEDEASLKKAVRSFPVIIFRKSPTLNELLSIIRDGKKIAKFLYPTDVTTFICGYVRKDFVDKIGIKNFEEYVSDYSLKIKGRQSSFGSPIIKYKVVNNHIKINEEFQIKDKTFKTEHEYYPVVFNLTPDQIFHKSTGKKCNSVSTEIYTGELRRRYNTFYNAIKDLYGEKADMFVFCTNLVGDMSRPSKTERINPMQMYSGQASLTKTLKAGS